MIGTIADWRSYATARGNSAPSSASDTLATQALTRASDYILHNYVRHFLPGYDVDSEYVDEATYVAADYELETPGFFVATYTASQQKVLTEVKGIKWTVKAGETGREFWQDATPTISKIEGMLDIYMPRDVGYAINSIGPL